MLRASVHFLIYPAVLVLVIVLAPTAASAVEGTTARDGIALFESKIRPVLARKCYGCHSKVALAEGKLEGKLLLDTRAGVLAGGAHGAIVVPGKPEESRLLAALAHEGEFPLSQT